MIRAVSSPEPARRGFLKKIAAALLGGLATLVPVTSAFLVFLDPLRRKAQAGVFLKVATLPSLPEDGSPRKFPVLSTRSDAWNRAVNVPVGAVYLRRKEGDGVTAFNVVCPHLGCFVDYSPARRDYLCPCHNSSFALDGSISDPKSPSPRGLDELDVEIRDGDEIWVKFQNFQATKHEKIPV